MRRDPPAGDARPILAACGRPPHRLGAGLAEQLARVLDVEGKIPRALEALGPVEGRDVVARRWRRPDCALGNWTDLGARVTLVDSSGSTPFDAPDASADVVVGLWSAFRGAVADQIAQASRVLRPGGRLLAVHDYGRDDVSRAPWTAA